MTEYDVSMPVAEYLKLKHEHDSTSKLVNRRVIGGVVFMDQREVRELHRAVLKPREGAQQAFEDEIGTTDPDSFPPCIQALTERLKAGEHMSHEARFALASFLVNVGMDGDDVVDYLDISSEFGQRETDYQVEHIRSGEYDPPSCSTMQRRELCTDLDDRCLTIGHPLAYYRGMVDG